MVSSFPVAMAAGGICGFLAGLGIGGGSLLVLWLTLVVQADPFTARCVNLMFFIPCALCASLFRWKQGDLQIKKIIAPILLGAITAGILSYFSSAVDTYWLRKIFGGLLIITGLREVFYKPMK
jgi:uncharacterized membrane protein YfcA